MESRTKPYRIRVFTVVQPQGRQWGAVVQRRRERPLGLFERPALIEDADYENWAQGVGTTQQEAISRAVRAMERAG